MANTCSVNTSNTKAAVKANNPGISRIDCSVPISAPVNAAFSMAKLFNRAFQAEKVMVMTIPARARNTNGLSLEGSLEKSLDRALESAFITIDC